MAFTKITAAGIGTTETVTVDGLTVINDGSFGGNLTVSGVLTYEDVTNVDSVGLITARNGIVVGSGITLSKDGDIFATGITTISENLKVGTGVTISPDGDGFFTGVITATSYSGIDLSDVTGATGDFSIADKIVHTGDTDTAIRFPNANTINFETAGSEAIRINSNGDIGINDTGPANFTGYTNVSIHGSSGGAITFGDDGTDEWEIYAGDGSIRVYDRTNTTERIRIDDNGRLLIGTTTEGEASADDLTIGGSGNQGITIRSGTSNYGLIYFSDATSGTGEYDGAIEYKHSDNFMVFRTGASERLRIDASGRVVIGHTSNIGIANHNGRFQLHGTDYDTATMSIVHNGNASHGAFLFFASQRSGSPGGSTVLQNNDSVGTIRFHAGDGTDMASYCAAIQVNIDGTPGSNDTPGRITFSTTADGASSPTERLRIDSSGRLGLGTNDPSSFNTYARDLVVARSSGDAGLTISAEDSSSEYGSLHFSGGTTVRSYIDVQNGSTGRMFLMNKMDGYMAFGTNNAERYRIHNNGRQSWNNTTFPYGETFHFYNGLSGRPSMSIYHGTDSDEAGLIMRHGRSGANSGAYTGKLMQFRNSSGNENGSIASNASVTAYNTSSDYRLKENEVTISDAISKVKQLKPYTFNFKETPNQKVDGFFAHEAQEVIPYAVMGEKDAEDMQQIDYGKLTPLLTAALQEAITEIESLKAEVAALKSS